MIVCNILINEVIKDISELDCPCFIPDTVDLKLRSHHGRDQANSDDMDKATILQSLLLLPTY